MERKFLTWIILLIFVLSLVPGCGPKKDKDSTPTLKTIQIEPEEAVLFPGEIQIFTAKGFDQKGKEMTGLTFTWSVDPSEGVSITEDGLFTAEETTETTGTYQVVCEAKGVTGRVNVFVEQRKLTTIEVDPDTAVVPMGSSRYFSAIGLDQKGDPIEEDITFAWMVDSEEAGTITQDGSFTAGEIPGEYELICKVGDVEKRIEIIVGTSKLAKIEVFPSSAVFYPGQESRFEAEGFDQAGDYMFDIEFDWSVESAEAGIITQDGYFTAGAREGNYKVICQAEDIIVEIPIRIAEASDRIETFAKQLVDDSQAAWASFVKSSRMTTILNAQALPAAEIVFSSISEVFYYVMDKPLFYYEPGEYNDYWQILDNAERYDVIQEGTWTYKEGYDEYDEENDEYYFIEWTIEITRNNEGANDTYTYNLVCKYETEETDQYWGTINCSNLEFVPETGTTYDDNLDFLINFELANSATGSLEGNAEASMTSKLDQDNNSYIIYNSLVGRTDGQFDYNEGAYALDGELSVLFDADQPDYFRGTISLPDADFEGELELSYVSNPLFKDQPLAEIINCRLIPNKLVLEGSLEDKNPESPLSAEGAFTLELKNAASFNFTGRYSEWNWPGIKLDFVGDLVSENKDQLVGTLCLEETAWNQIDVRVGYVLTLDEVRRRIDLNAKSSDVSKIDITLTSDWGEAAIDMDLEFDPQLFYYDRGYLMPGEPSLSGQVSVQGEKVGVISLSDIGIRVDYNDGTFETF